MRRLYSKLGKVLGLAVDTVSDYLHHMESAFLLSFLEKWTSSWSEKVYAQRKIYLQDPGVKTVFTGAGDTGSKAENSVFMAMKRCGIAAGYFAESDREVDFVIGPPDDPLPVEVKYLQKFDWQDRRFAGLKLFVRRYPGVRRALVISQSVQTETREGTVDLQVIPLWKFLLDPAAALHR